MNLSKLLRNHWDRTGAVVCVLLGLVALYAGWQGVSDHTLATEQLPYLASGALFGLFLLGVGATLWLSADLRDTWKALREVHDQLVDDQLQELDGEAAPRDEDLASERATSTNGTGRRQPLRASRR